jgi:molybdopterin molybdotransferase
LAFIDFNDSLKVVKNIKISSYRTKIVKLSDSLDYILANDIVAFENSPLAPTSAMDGYAFKYKENVDRLKIGGINPAGSKDIFEIKNSECIKTFTGSLMPKGSDTLIPIENVKVLDNEIEIILPVKKGSHVREIGENYAKNELLISNGTKIDFPQIGVMASLNISTVNVYKKPIVGIFATGSELLDVGEEQTSFSQIRSSNHFIIEAIVKKYGGEALRFGCIKDDKESISAMMGKALKQSDIVVTTGGVSVGDYDFVKDVIREMDFEVLFQGVNLKPGQHIMLARKGDKFILGLPGFAYSSTVTALIYLLPLMGKFINYSTTLTNIKATMLEAYTKKSNKTEFIACNYYLEEGKYKIDFAHKKQGTSAILTNILGNSALMMLNPTDKIKNIGDEVDILIF